MISEIIQEARIISHNLSPVGLYEFGLHSSVEQLIKRFNLSRNKLSIEFHSELDGKRFVNDIEINIFRIIQESIQNAIKHSNAKLLKINITYQHEELFLCIKDNGVGINFDQKNNTEKGYNGIKNIEDRANILGAQLKIITKKNEGFEICITLKAKAINYDKNIFS